MPDEFETQPSDASSAAESGTQTNTPRTSENDLVGHSLGEFEILRRLGKGGMGEVYLARQKSLKRNVAVKVLRAELAANKTALQRFQTEAETIARLNHANIVQIYAIGEERGLHFMAMEYVEGRNLREYISKKGTPDLPLALNIMRQVAAALSRAGENGFVHRDIKPENILLTKKGEVKVADFGLSRCFAGGEGLNITQSGVTMGTPLYMSPEQVQGKTVDPRSDIYSFGVTCYHMLRGEPPFRGASAFDVALQHVQNAPPQLQQARPDLPHELCQMVHRMMAKKPDDRFPNCKEILREIIRIRESMSTGTSQNAIASTSIAPARTLPEWTADVLAKGTYSGGIPATQQILSSATISSLQSGTLVLSHTPFPWRRLLAVGLAGVLGVTAYKLFPAHQWEKEPITEERVYVDTSAAPTRLRMQELQTSLQEKNAKPEQILEQLMDLLKLYGREGNYEEGLRILDPASLSRLPALQDYLKPKDNPKGSIIQAIGRAYLEADRNEADRSMQILNQLAEQLKPRKFNPGQDPYRQLDDFLRNNPSWKKSLSDLLERNLANLPGRNLEMPWEGYKSYFPRTVNPTIKK